MNGLLLLDKPDGITSAEAVRRVKVRVGRHVKVGHLGTLDPFATGLLPLCLGEATKIAQFLNVADKAYTGVIQLGAATDTGDRTGSVTEQGAVAPFDAAALAAVAAQWTGEFLQSPPMYSAVKRDGVPLYKLARLGLEVERTPRPVRIDALALHAKTSLRLGFTVACSKGTYIRVLAEEVGRALGAPAHLLELRRTEFGRFSIERAVKLDAWTPDGEAGFVAIGAALAHLPCVALDAVAALAARQGKAEVLRHLPAPGIEAELLLLDPDGCVAAVMVRAGANWRYGRVLAATQALHSRTAVLATSG